MGSTIFIGPEEKRDKVRAYIGERKREVNRVTGLDHATFSIISPAYRLDAHDPLAIGCECSDPVMRPTAARHNCPQMGAMFPVKQAATEVR
jgi:hypothetical protein